MHHANRTFCGVRQWHKPRRSQLATPCLTAFIRQQPPLAIGALGVKQQQTCVEAAGLDLAYPLAVGLVTAFRSGARPACALCGSNKLEIPSLFDYPSPSARPSQQSAASPKSDATRIREPVP